MQQFKRVIIPAEVADAINGYLNATNEDEYQGEDNTIVYTAYFGNGITMDVKCCGCDDDASWTEAILFERGRQVCFTEPCDEFFGVWEFEYDDNEYIVFVYGEYDEKEEK